MTLEDSIKPLQIKKSQCFYIGFFLLLKIKKNRIFPFFLVFYRKMIKIILFLSLKVNLHRLNVNILISMKKNTKLLLIAILLLSVNLSYSQNRKINKENSKSISHNHPNTEQDVILNEENQRFLNENGVVRCLTEEMNNKYRLNNPNVQSKQQFEDWIAPLVQQYKAQQASRIANNVESAQMQVYTIPIIFHVVSGTQGDAPDLDAQYVNAQIEQLNLDFSNQAGGATGYWSSVAADAQIVFVPAQVDPNGNPLAEPGINRVYGYPGQLSTADFDNTIKPATIWDRTLYANCWTGNLGGGLLGYAQFPDSSGLPGMPASGGSANTDGVVCLYTSIGSVANPHPNGGVYAAGRTLTHEIGHWIGLRHIWGDGNCSVDDFCNDTPNQNGSSSGCPNTNDTCIGGDRDMVENFMDYSFDTCMNLFTADQVARMAVVMQNSPGRSELASSNTGNAGPIISFALASDNVIEGSDCNFTDVTVDLTIAEGASQNTTVNLTVQGATADAQDYTLLNNSVVFSAGSTATQSVVIRVFNDGFVEGEESIDLTFTVNANGGDATAGNNNFTLVITDDDVVPVNIQTITLIDSNLETTDATNWFVIDNDGDGNNFLSANSSGTDLYGNGTIVSVFFASESNGAIFGTGANFTPDNFLLSDMISIPSNASSVNLSYGIAGYGDSEPYEVYWTTDNTNVSTITSGNLIDSGNTLDDNGEFRNIDMSAYIGQTGYLAFRHNSPGTNNGNGVTEGLFLLDNINFEAIVAKSIQTDVNTSTSNDLLALRSSGTVYASDSVSTDLMLDITNVNNDDFGCVDISVSRAGTSAQSYNGSSVSNYVTDKTFTITPSNILTTSNVTVDFYFTEAEILGYEATTGQSRNSISILRDNGVTTEVVSASVSSFGSDYKLSGTFTSGIEGTYYFGVPAALSTSEFDFDQFAVYPNPTNGKVTIALSTNQDVNLSLFDIRGRQIFNNLYSNNNSIFNKTINLNTNSTGIYILKVEAGNKSAFKRIVVK